MLSSSVRMLKSYWTVCYSKKLLNRPRGPGPPLLCWYDGTTRFVFRKVNEVTKKDAQPLPHIDDTLHGAKWFSTLDLAPFTTQLWLFQFHVMPSGLCNAPGMFQHLMERVPAGLHWTSCLVLH